MKRNIVLITALIFLFGQIGILEIGHWYFGFNNDAGLVVTLMWASGILCGIFSHWSIVYLKKPCKDR